MTLYVPSHFEETRTEELHALIAAHPLGTLVTRGPEGMDANHIPFVLEPEEGGRVRMIAHVARANPVWKEVKDGDEALVIFRAEQAYISPSWYPSKHELHKQVPTWNYRVVHVHGRIAIRDDERFVRGVVARLTRINEGRAGNERPWKMTDSAPEYIDHLLTLIVGIEIEVVKMVGKWKLSQNKEERDRSNAAAELEKRGEVALSAQMLKTLG